MRRRWRWAGNNATTLHSLMVLANVVGGILGEIQCCILAAHSYKTTIRFIHCHPKAWPSSSAGGSVAWNGKEERGSSGGAGDRLGTIYQTS